MKPVFRFTAAACVAVALSSLTFPHAQEEADEPQVVTREYNVRGVGTEETRPGTRTNGIGDVLAPDRLLPNFDRGRPEDAWWLRDSGDEARCWDYAYSAIGDIADVTGASEEEGFDRHLESETVTRVSGTEEAHRRIRWGLDAMRDLTDARVSVVVYRLPDEAVLNSPLVGADGVAALAKGARLAGAVTGGLGDPLVMQRTTHRSYIADIEFSVATNAAMAEPVLATLNTGSEFVFGVVSLPDGRLWIQGWRATLDLAQMREQNTTGGKVELPDTRYRYVPVSAELENGGAVLLDGGEGERFLVQAKCDRVVRDQELKCSDGSVVKFLNVVRALRGHGLSDVWIMTPNSEQVLGEQLLAQVVLDRIEDGPYNDAAMWIENRIETGWISIHTVGPYLAVRASQEAMEEPEGRAEYARVLAAIDRLRTRPTTVAVRVTAMQLTDEVALPEGIVNGRPSAADVAECLARGEVNMSRLLANMTGQANDLLNFRMAAHVRDYSTMTGTGVAVDDPEVGTLVMGQQFRWVAHDAGDGKLRFEVRAGMSVGPSAFEQVTLRDGVTIERTRSSLAQMRAGDNLAVGERMATVSPAAGAEGELIVLVIERLQ
jgi:hypothetical protein